MKEDVYETKHSKETYHDSELCRYKTNVGCNDTRGKYSMRGGSILECEGKIVGEYTPMSSLGSGPEIVEQSTEKSDGCCGKEFEGRMVMA